METGIIFILLISFIGMIVVLLFQLLLDISITSQPEKPGLFPKEFFDNF